MQRLGSGVALLALVLLTIGSAHEVDASHKSSRTAAPVPTAPIVQGTLLGMSAVDATHAWAVGFFINGSPAPQAIIVATADGGVTWTRQQPPHTSWLGGVSFVNQSTGWIVGNPCAPQALCPGVSVTHDGGMSWVDQSPPVLFSYAVRFVSATTGWVVGDAIAGTIDGGVSWALQSQPANMSFLSLWAIDSSHAWAVGTDTVTGTSVVFATVNGSTWSQSAVLPTNFTPRTVFFIDANNGWLAGRLGGTGAVEVTHDAGLHWNPQIIPSGTSDLRSVMFASSTIGWAVGTDTLNTGSSLLATTDGGASWQAQTAPNSSGSLASVAVVSSNVLWVVGAGHCAQASILATSTGGMVWTDQLTRTPFITHLNAVATIGSSSAWAVGADSCGSGVILNSGNSGSTWTAQAVPSDVGSLLSVSFADASNGWAVGELRRGSDGMPVGAAIVATSDGGMTWIRQSIPAGIDQLTGVKFASASFGWAIGSDLGTFSGEILATVNGGATWARQQIPGGMCCMAGLSFIDALHGWAGGIAQAGTTGVVLATNDGGSTWGSQTLPVQALLGTATPAGICFSDASHGWAVGSFVSGPGGTAMIAASVDGGATWGQQTTPAFGSLAAVTCPSANVAWAAGSPFGAAILATANGGTQWSSQGAPSDVLSLQGMASASTTLVWAVGITVGGLGVILNTTNAGTTWTEQSYSYPPVLPSPPTQVTAYATGNMGEVQVAWQPPSTGPPVTWYDIKAYNSHTGSTSTFREAAGSTSLTIGQLNNCTSYRFDVYAVAASGSSDPAPSVYATPYTVPAFNNGSPRYVVILIGGTNTENPAPAPDYQPLGLGAVGSCFGSDYVNGQPPPGEAPVPPQLKAIGDTFADDKSIAAVPHQLLTSQLSAEGAVVLPFSYTGAYLVGSSTDQLGAAFHLNPFTKQDVTFTEPPADAVALENEVMSINNVWPGARIVIVGHSLGGLIAKLWWDSYGTFDSATSRDHVAAVFSLDAPIGGVQDTLLCTGIVASALVPLCSFLVGVGPYVANEYFSSWLMKDAIWQSILARDGNGQYIPVGTFGDDLYGILDWPVPGLISQLVFTPGCGQVCNTAGYDFVSDCNPGFTGIAVIDNHSFVKNCPNVVNYIGCVLIGQATPCLLPTTPGAAAIQARPKLVATLPIITGALSPSVLSPGQSATISGTGLGTAQGFVQFMGETSGLVNASVSSWTDTQISLIVPTGSTTGPVRVVTNSGTSVVVGDATVLAAANGVTTLTASLVGADPLDGQPATIGVLAADATGKAVSNATVGLSNGVGVVTGQTDTAGRVNLQMSGFGSMGLVAYSGSAFTPITVTWQAPPPMTLTLVSSTTTPATGAPISISATLFDAAGKPVVSQPVAFQLVGPASIMLSNSISSTDNSGMATISVTNTGNGPFIVAATADSYAANASIAIRPILPNVRAANPSSPAPPPNSRAVNPSSSGSPASRMPNALFTPKTTLLLPKSAIRTHAYVSPRHSPRPGSEPELSLSLDRFATRVFMTFGRGDMPDPASLLWIAILVVLGALIGARRVVRRSKFRKRDW
jgi:photosystem II stability/assembly factor-like uncharacterized protein